MTKIALVGKYPPGTLEAFQAQLAGEDVQFALVNTPEAYEKLDDADCMVLRVFKAPRDVIERNAKLKLLCRWGVGYDTVDIACAGEKGVMVTNTPGANAYSVSELAVLLMLAVGRNLMFHNKSIQSGVWSRTLFTDNAVTLNAKKVGIVGGGNIGRQVARKVQAFGAQVQYYDVFRLKPEMEREFAMTYVSLEELVRTSDVISLHVPLTEDNHHMLDASMIAKMKKNAILVNTARGGLIDDSALLVAIDEGRLMGAGLDCVEDDPLPAGHPLLNHPNIVITPHIGGVASDIGEVMIPMISANIKRFLHGEKVQYLVNEKELNAR